MQCFTKCLCLITNSFTITILSGSCNGRPFDIDCTDLLSFIVDSSIKLLFIYRTQSTKTEREAKNA